MITTIVVWDSNLPVDTDSINKFSDTMTEQEKTDGSSEKSIDSNNTDYRIFKRRWVDIESAQTWIDFITTLDPVSATIESNEQQTL